jgi:hypothetical protein
VSQRFVTLTAAEWLRREGVKVAIAEEALNHPNHDHALVSDHGYGCVVVTAKNLSEDELTQVIDNGRNVARWREDLK